MSIGAIIAVVIAAIIVVAAGTLAVGEMRRRALIQRFGPEYDRLVSEKGARRAGAELTSRQRLLARLNIRPLTDGERENYTRRWNSVQEQFVDDPNHSVSAALSLITAVLRDRGYPTDDGDETMRAVSVDHALALQDYRKAQEVARDEHDVSTEDLRQALLGYRRLFRELTGSGNGQARAWAQAPAPESAPVSAPAPASVPAPVSVPAPASAHARDPAAARDPDAAAVPVMFPAPVPVPFPASVRARMSRASASADDARTDDTTPDDTSPDDTAVEDASADDTAAAGASADDSGGETDRDDRETADTGRQTADKAMKELPVTTGHDRDIRMGSGEIDQDISGPLLTEAEESRASWQRIQAGFVDDPRGSVAHAAMMVEETADTLVAAIQERERVLRGTWEGTSAAADTEKLRIALGKYRTLYDMITDTSNRI